MGLYLARDDAAIEVDESNDALAQQVAQVDEGINQLFDQLVSLSKSLTPEQKEALEDFWIEYADGEPKPTRTTAKVEDLEALIAEVTRLTLGGDFVEPIA